MKGVFTVILAILLVLPSVLAQNLDIRIYRELDDFGRKYGDLDVVPGEQVKFFIQIENENTDRKDSKQEIKNIEVTASILEIDDGDDIEEDYEDFDLKPDKRKSLSFSFVVPEKIEDIDYTLEIEVEGREDGNDFSLTEEFSVDVRKEIHNLLFTRLEFDPKEIKCNEVSFLDMEVLNLGTNDEEIVLTVKNDDLGISLQRQFELEEFPGEDEYELRIPLRIPADLASNTYTFDVILQYSTNLLVSEKAPLGVNCGTVSSPSEPQKVTSETKKSEKVTVAKVESPTQIVVKKDPVLWPFYVIGLLILIAIIAIVAIKKR